jgi:hypothetical protein
MIQSLGMRQPMYMRYSPERTATSTSESSWNLHLKGKGSPDNDVKSGCEDIYERSFMSFELWCKKNFLLQVPHSSDDARFLLTTSGSLNSRKAF